MSDSCDTFNISSSRSTKGPMKTDTTVTPPSEVSCAAPAAVGPPARTEGGSSRLINLVGRRFGRLVVVSRAENDRCGHLRWHVKCDCGEERVVQGSNLRSGHTTSCGCFSHEQASLQHLDDLTGRRFGRLVVVSRAENDRRGNARWHVKCGCGEERVVSGAHLRSGNTTSCGCRRREQASLQHLDDLTSRRFGRLVVVSRAGNSRRGKARWRVKCDCCEERVISGDNLRSGHTTSCGCYNREVLSAQRGDKHPSWKPELTQEDRDRRRLGTPTNLAGRVLAQQIRCRDRATCLVCGAPNSTHVHHLQPWAAHRDLRYNPANLVTLCKECHYQFHQLYGKDADLNDLEDYLKP